LELPEARLSLTLGHAVILVPPMTSRPQRAARRTEPVRALPLRVLAALLACLLASSAVGQVAHMLLVQHSVCAEHGELVELHPAAEHGSATAHMEGPQPDSEHPAGSDPETLEHDHCQVLCRAEQQAAAVGSAASQLEPAQGAKLALHRRPGVVFASSAGLLAMAPKTSPPGGSIS
jgi:outer membrane biosynthesis protein TonB